jgi:hypothetical protein
MTPELGSIAEAVSTIKTDVHDLKLALLDPDRGLSTRLALTERTADELKEAHARYADELAEMRIAHRVSKWAIAAAGSLGLAALVSRIWPTH